MGTNTTFSVCFGDDPAVNRAVVLYGSGRARVDRRTPRGDPVVTMRLLLDGRPYRGSLGRKGIVRDRPEDRTVRQTWTVELTPGVHRVAVTAETATAYGMSEPVEVAFDAERAALPVTIGVHGLLPLRGPVP